MNELQKLLENAGMVREGSNDFVQDAVAQFDLKWRRTVVNSDDHEIEMVGMLPNKLLFMIYYDLDDKNVGWAESELPSSGKLKDVFWDDSGTDYIDGAIERLTTWVNTNGEQTGYEQEDEIDHSYGYEDDDGEEYSSDEDLDEANPDGSISDDEGEERDHLLAMFEMELDELVSNAIQDAEEIGGQFRSPGILAQLRNLLQTKQTEMRRARSSRY